MSLQIFSSMPLRGSETLVDALLLQKWILLQVPDLIRYRTDYVPQLHMAKPRPRNKAKTENEIYKSKELQ